MEVQVAKEQIRKSEAAMVAINNKARDENRGCTREEELLLSQLEGAIDALKLELPERALTVQGPGARDYRGADVPYALVPPNGKKDWHSLFGNQGLQWTDRETNFFSAVFSGRFHPGLIRATAGMSESIPSSGGFLVPQEQAARIHSVALESELVMPRAYVQPMMSDNIKIPGTEIGDHSVNLFGGFTASFTAEEGTIDEHNPKVRSMELHARKLTGLIRFSSELSSDTPGGMTQIENLCGRGLGWFRDKSFLRGVGSTEPLGILNADCVVTCAKESGQKRNTIVYENLLACMSRMFAGSFANSTWVAHQGCIPQLLSLSLGIGVGGSAIPVMTRGGLTGFEILTRPCIFTEKVPLLGNKGDIGLYDFSQYVCGLRSELKFDQSIHVAFAQDQILARIISRFDGQPLWDKALTLADGTTTVSPFVLLADRLT